jgi:oligoribonuclease (3'-5' exoribonuclease)
MSINSSMSGMSINMHNEEVSLEEAVTSTFKSIQGHINACENNICGLAVADDRGDFRYSYELQKKIEFNLSEMLLLFKDLKSIVKQIKLKPTNEEDRQWSLSYDIEFANSIKEEKAMK